MAEPALFQSLYNGFEGPMVNGSTNAADQLLNAVAPELAAALGLFVIVVGVMTMFGKLTWQAAILYGVRALAISNILTAALYNQWVETFFLQTLPGHIVAAIGGGEGTGGNIAAQFDRLQNAVDHQAAILLAANTGLMEIGDRIAIFLADQFAGLMLMACFAIYFLAQVVMAVVTPAGAVLLVFFLFNATRHWAMGWLGVIVGLLIMELMVAVELQIILQQFTAYMGDSETAGTGADSAQNIHQLWQVGLYFGFGFFMLVVLPVVAGAISGNSVSNVVVQHISKVNNAAVRGAGAAVRAATGSRN